MRRLSNPSSSTRRPKEVPLVLSFLVGGPSSLMDSRQVNLLSYSVTAAASSDAALELAKELSTLSEDGKVTWSQLFNKLTSREYSFNKIDAAAAIRYLEDNEKIFLDNKCGLVSFRLVNHSSIEQAEYERRQRQIQDGWTRADEIAISKVLHEEWKEVNNSTKLLSIKELEQRGPKFLGYYTLSCDLENSKGRRRRPLGVAITK